MRRGIHRLSPAKVRTAKVGRHADGGNLYLEVEPGAHGLTRKKWIFRFTVAGRERHMGLGPVSTIGLAAARERARAAREQLLDGIDPIEARNARIAEQRVASMRALTFREAAQQYIESHDAGWRSEKHRREWVDTLDRFVHPVIGSLPVNTITVDLVLKVLRPIWETKTVTASRLRGRIEMVIDRARAQKLFQGDNPAEWETLQHLLPKPTRVHRKEHFDALPYDQIGAFLAALRKLDGVPARGLEFLILTAARFGEVRYARWSEIEGDTWTIPAERMKAHREHRVPLCARALEILDEMRSIRTCDLIFPGRNGKQPIGPGALLQVIERLGHKGSITAHGFRSSFRSWCGARTNFPREVAEMALAHQVGDATEQAYARDDLFEKRRKLMDAWDRYCAAPPAAAAENVRPLRVIH
jgi:integrase